MDHNDILFQISEPLDVVSAVARRVKELRPHWQAHNEYPGYVGIYLPSGEYFNCGTVNDTWGGDYYASRDATNPEGHFETELDGDECQDVELIAKILIDKVNLYLMGRAHRADFVEALKQFAEATETLTEEYGMLNDDDQSAAQDGHPFRVMDGEVNVPVWQWLETVKKNFGSEE